MNGQQLLETMPDEEPDTIVDPMPVPIWLPLPPPPESEELDDLLEELPTRPIKAMGSCAMIRQPIEPPAMWWPPPPSRFQAVIATLRRWLSLD